MRPIIKKDHEDFPDYYGLTLYYVTGDSEQYKIALHRILDNGFTAMEFVTHDDVWHIVPLVNIKRFEFDKNFSKIVAIKEKLAKQK